MGQRARAGLLFALWLALAGTIVAIRLSTGAGFDTNIRSILPSERLSPGAQAAVSELTGSFADRVAFLVRAEDPGAAEDARTDLNERLTASGLFVDDQATGEDTARWIFANRNELLCEERPEDFTDETARRVWQQALGRVYGVGTPVSGDLLRADPFLLTFRLADCLSARVGGANTPSLLSGRLTEPASSLATQDRLSVLIAEWQAEWREENVELARMGTVFHAAHAAGSARGEISRVSGLGLFGVIALFLFAFRRPSAILLVAALIGASFLTGLAVTLLLFSEVHLLVLVFAAMLVGIVSDYAVHALAARASHGWPDAKASRALIFRPLTVSMLTTMAGFAGLWLLGLSLFAQLAVFAIAGIFAAWALVLYVLVPLDLAPRASAMAKQDWSERVDAMARYVPDRRLLLFACAALLLATLLGVLRATTLDDVRQFQPRDAGLMAEEETVLDALGAGNGQLYLVSEGDSLDAAKLAEEDAIGLLGRDRIAGLAYTKFDPSAERRQVTRDVLQTRLESPYIAEAQEQFGLERDIEISISRPARPAWLDDLHVEAANGQHYLIAQLRTEPGTSIFFSSPDAQIVDVAQTYSDAFAAYRRLAGWALGLANLVAIFEPCIKEGARQAIGPHHILVPHDGAAFGATRPCMDKRGCAGRCFIRDGFIDIPVIPGHFVTPLDYPLAVCCDDHIVVEALRLILPASKALPQPSKTRWPGGECLRAAKNCATAR
jgi:predicted exporter